MYSKILTKKLLEYIKNIYEHQNLYSTGVILNAVQTVDDTKKS